MMLMFGAQGNPTAYYLCGKHEGKIGMLMGPTNLIKPRSWMPFALDNDAYACFTKGTAWNEPKWLVMLEKVRLSGIKPRWCAVPDVVMDPVATLENWNRYAPMAAEKGFALAFVCQNGHTAKDVPAGAEVVFIGGDTRWKYQTLPMWCSEFPRVHVGRVNEVWRLDRLVELGVESCDGSGWFRDTDEGRRIRSLKAWLEGYKFEQSLLNICP